VSLIKIFAYLAILAGIGILLTTELMHVGIILLIEGGVLFTLVETKPKQVDPSKNNSI